MARAPDSPDSRARDSWLRGAWAPDSGAVGLSLGRAIQLFLAAKGAEGASPKTLEWYHMVLGRAGDAFSLQRILGHVTLDMVKRYVALVDTDLAQRHRVASSADRLLAAGSRAEHA